MKNPASMLGFWNPPMPALCCYGSPIYLRMSACVVSTPWGAFWPSCCFNLQDWARL